VADGAGDEDVTPSEIAHIIQSARDAAESTPPSRAMQYLDEALDAVSDGMPADYVAMILYAALGATEAL
jgi:hypothetical protein